MPRFVERMPGGRGLGHFSQNRMYVNRRAGLVLVLNPKVGTTFFREALSEGLKEHCGLSDPSEGRYWPFEMPRQFPIARVRDYLTALRHPDEFEFYAFVRNPYARLFSAWKDKFYNGHHNGYPPLFRGSRLSDVRGFARRRNGRGGKDGELIPFDVFVRYVLSGEIGRMDHHWDAQHAVLMMDRFHYAGLFRIEDERIEGLQTIFGKLGFGKAWITARAGQLRNESGSDRPARYDESLAADVYAKFRRDFDTLGYDRESWRQMDSAET
jgi:hypothetical protein